MKEINRDGIKKIQLQLLDAVHSFCTKNGINYSLCGGTLIGAVRHTGYIPWDDDIDIMMFRSDYDRFVREYKDVNSVVCAVENTPNYEYPFAKVSDQNSVIEEFADINTPLGVNIDVFPVDSFPDTIKGSIRFLNHMKIYRVIIELKRVKVKDGRAWYKNWILHFSKFVFRCVSLNKLCVIVNNLAQKNDDRETSFLGIGVWGYGIRERCDKTWYDNYIDLEFEGKMYRSISGYDKYLTTVYGDYLKLPPVEKQITHHSFRAWIK